MQSSPRNNYFAILPATAYGTCPHFLLEQRANHRNSCSSQRLRLKSICRSSTGSTPTSVPVIANEDQADSCNLRRRHRPGRSPGDEEEAVGPDRPLRTRRWRRPPGGSQSGRQRGGMCPELMRRRQYLRSRSSPHQSGRARINTFRLNVSSCLPAIKGRMMSTRSDWAQRRTRDSGR